MNALTLKDKICSLSKAIQKKAIGLIEYLRTLIINDMGTSPLTR
jgi:hypothetical protein